MDLENQSLDLNLSNDKLVKVITNNSQYRMQSRFKKMSDRWVEQCGQLVDGIPTSKLLPQHRKDKHKLLKELSKGSKGSKGVDLVKKEFEYYFNNANMSASKVAEPICVGDLVTISEGGTEFYMIANCPDDIDSMNYTYINSKGRILFGPSFAIKFRIPKVIPEHYVGVVKSMVMVEEKTLDVAPIGISDKSNSRSKESMPLELRQSRANLPNESKATETSETSGENDDDFIASQASSRLLTNTDVNTYVVPEAARAVYSKPLTKLSIQSNDNYKNLSIKLELLHRILQFEETGDVHGCSRNMSIFQILHFVQQIKITPAFDQLDVVALKELSKTVNRSYGLHSRLTRSSNLGKLVTDTKNSPRGIDAIESLTYNLPLYFAVLLILRKQARLWKINEQNLVNPVTSVVVLPIGSKGRRDQLIQHVKKHHGSLVEYIVARITDSNCDLVPPKYYDECIDLFKDFIIDNLRNDFEAETLVTTLIRKIDSQLQLSDKYYSYEYGKSKCYDILQLLQVFEGEYENPVMWASGLELGTPKTGLNDEYYSFLETNGMKQGPEQDQGPEESGEGERDPEDMRKHFGSEEFTTFEQTEIDDLYKQDPMEELRQEYTDPIFCIDSESAHEIDDGIAIRSDDTKHTVTIHIANPSSYIKPRSSLSQIALNKGVTTYLPEGPIKMLPEFMSELSGLGVNRPKEDPIKTFAIEFSVEKDFGKKDLGDLLKEIESSAQIKFYNTYNYPTGYTYGKVDRVLGDQDEGDEYSEQLKTIYSLSKKLKQIRLDIGNGHDFEFGNSSINVEYKSGNQPGTGHQFTIKDGSYELIMDKLKISMTSSSGTSMSQVLVSEMMIIGNYLTSMISNRNDIPIIYRNQIMDLPANIVKQVQHIRETLKPGEEFKDMVKILRVMNSARIDSNNKGHESLGLQNYCQITSPLRRYTDLINQWQLQNYYLQQNSKPVSEESTFDLGNIINHLQAKDLINKQFSRFSNRFWQGILIREYFKLRELLPKDQLMPFKMFINHALSKDKYSVKIDKLSEFKSYIETTDGGFEPEEIVSARDIELQKIDFIENELSFRYKGKTKEE